MEKCELKLIYANDAVCTHGLIMPSKMGKDKLCEMCLHLKYMTLSEDGQRIEKLETTAEREERLAEVFGTNKGEIKV